MRKINVKRHAAEQPLDPSYRIIPLTRNQVTLVSTHRYEELSKFNWCATHRGTGKGFIAVRRIGTRKEGRVLPMHEVICPCPEGMEPDHINGNALDNRDENLRPSTHHQNTMNKPIQPNNTSGFKGVSYRKDRRKWGAYIKFNGKMIHLGRFIDREDAARAYDRKAIELFGDFARTNFPRSDYD